MGVRPVSPQKAAQRHDSHELFSIINQYSPIQPKRRMHLRNAQGHIASPIEEISQLKRFVVDTWQGPPQFPTLTNDYPGMPFSVAEFEHELSLIPATKAVARPCAPGIAWKTVAPTITSPIYDILRDWWSRPTPSWFRDSWMILIPKPNKPPVTPGALRPLALQVASRAHQQIHCRPPHPHCPERSIPKFFTHAALGIPALEIHARCIAESCPALP